MINEGTTVVLKLLRAPSPFAEPHNETDEKYHNKDEKQYSRDFSGAYRNAAESKNTGNDSNH